MAGTAQSQIEVTMTDTSSSRCEPTLLAPRRDRPLDASDMVIEGMALLSARPRGTGNLGFYQTDHGEAPIPIRAARLAADMPEADRPRFEAMRTEVNVKLGQGQYAPAVKSDVAAVAGDEP